MTPPKPVAYVVRCQPNSTFYINNHQDVPYDKAQQLETHFEKAWAQRQPPYVSSFTLADAQKKLNPAGAQRVFSAVVDIRGRALPGNGETSDQTALTAIHNTLGAMFMHNLIDSNQITLLASDFRDARDRITARQNFNSRAEEYKLPVAMFISGVKTPVDQVNFEGVCYKVALKR